MVFAVRHLRRSGALALAICLCLFRLKAEATGFNNPGGFRPEAGALFLEPGGFRPEAGALFLEPGGFRLEAETLFLEPRGFRPEAGAPFLEPGGFRLQAEGQATGHLKISGTHFVNSDGTTFDWRGISAFRLLELVAHGKESEADAYLAWAAGKKLTVVRVFGMSDVLFKLSSADGQHALPRLLEMAQRRGLHVEVVAFADTATIKVDFPRHVKAIAAICARYPNALLEIANEPVHPTQARELHDPAYVASLAQLVPAGVPVSLGSVENGDAFAAGSYVTWHAPRSGTGGWAAQIARGAALVRRFKKPIISDEPIGAADRAIPGRRDNVPAHFRDAAIAARRAGLGMTFHYEGGLLARLPSATELACLDAWIAGLSAKR